MGNFGRIMGTQILRGTGMELQIERTSSSWRSSILHTSNSFLKSSLHQLLLSAAQKKAKYQIDHLVSCSCRLKGTGSTKFILMEKLVTEPRSVRDARPSA